MKWVFRKRNCTIRTKRTHTNCILLKVFEWFCTFLDLDLYLGPHCAKCSSRYVYAHLIYKIGQKHIYRVVSDQNLDFWEFREITINILNSKPLIVHFEFSQNFCEITTFKIIWNILLNFFPDVTSRFGIIVAVLVWWFRVRYILKNNST